MLELGQLKKSGPRCSEKAQSSRCDGYTVVMEAKGPCFKEICPCGLNKEIKGHACILLSKDLGKNGVQGLGDETVRQRQRQREGEIKVKGV